MSARLSQRGPVARWRPVTSQSFSVEGPGRRIIGAKVEARASLSRLPSQRLWLLHRGIRPSAGLGQLALTPLTESEEDLS